MSAMAHMAPLAFDMPLGAVMLFHMLLCVVVPLGPMGPLNMVPPLFVDLYRRASIDVFDMLVVPVLRKLVDNLAHRNLADHGPGKVVAAIGSGGVRGRNTKYRKGRSKGHRNDRAFHDLFLSQDVSSCLPSCGLMAAKQVNVSHDPVKDPRGPRCLFRLRTHDGPLISCAQKSLCVLKEFSQVMLARHSGILMSDGPAPRYNPAAHCHQYGAPRQRHPPARNHQVFRNPKTGRQICSE